MEETLNRFMAVFDQPYDAQRHWRETRGHKLVGCAPMHLPEELVHAAGVRPFVLQEGREAITAGDSYIYPFFCGFVRNTVDLAARGRLDFLDGVVFPDTCLQMRAACSVLKAKLPVPYLEFLQLPVALRRPTTLAKTMAKLEQLRASLQRFTGRELTDAAIWESIQVYNRNRALLRRLYELRGDKPEALRAKEVLAIVTASMLWPKEEHSQWLQEVLAELENKEPTTENRVRLFLSGHLCQAPQVEILELIDAVGGVVVGDDLYTGYRYFATDAEADGNPIEALARRYLQNIPPCPTRSDPENDWGQYLVQMARRTSAQGVIVLLVKFCEPHIFYYPHLRQVLAAAGVPHLLIETEHGTASLEAIRTRLQAFVEMVGQG